jgi:hypothetical protein
MRPQDLSFGVANSWPGLFAAQLAVNIVYEILHSVYRIYFHLLAGFPGKTLAKATYWHETFYDVF